MKEVGPNKTIQHTSKHGKIFLKSNVTAKVPKAKSS